MKVSLLFMIGYNLGAWPLLIVDFFSGGFDDFNLGLVITILIPISVGWYFLTRFIDNRYEVVRK